MSFAPNLHIPGYRVSGNSIIFTIDGSNSSGVISVTIGSRGTYTSAPSVAFSGAGGALATARMGIKTIAFTPGALTGDISVTSANGSGAVLTPSYGAPDLAFSGDTYFVSPATAGPVAHPSISVSGGAGAGATYSLLYQVDGIPVTNQGGLYADPLIPLLSHNLGEGFDVSYGFADITYSSAALFIVVADDDPCSGGRVPLITINPNYTGGTGFASTAGFKPRVWTPPSEPLYWDYDTYYWHPALDALPEFEITSPMAGVSGTLVGRYQIHDGTLNVNIPAGPHYPFVLSNTGTGYVNPTPFTISGAGSPITITGTIQPDGGGQLDITTLVVDQAGDGHLSDMGGNFLGYFNDYPTITIDHAAGGGADAVLEITGMRLARIEATPANFDFTKANIELLGSSNRIGVTAGDLRDMAGTTIKTPSMVKLRVAERGPTTVTNEGSGYGYYGGGGYDSRPSWNQDIFCTFTNGAITQVASPVISFSRRVKGFVLNYSNEYDSASSPFINLAAPTSGTTPTFYYRARLFAIQNTARGSGYSTPISVSFSGFYGDTALSTAKASSTLSQGSLFINSLIITSRGSGYVAGDVVSIGGVQFLVSAVEIDSINVLNTGAGYGAAPTISFSGGGQTVAATATSTLGAITSSLASLPELTAADINLTTGDSRKIAMAFANLFNKIFGADISQRVGAGFDISFNPATLDRTFAYSFDFVVGMSTPHSIKPE